VSYTVRVDLGLDPVTGKRRQRAETFRTKDEAETALAKWVAEIAQGTAVDAAKITVAEYLTVHWLPTLTKRSSTLRRYRDLLEKHAIPIIGGVKLAKLSPLQVQDLYQSRLDVGLSPTTVNMLHNVLHKALKQAVRWGVLPRNVTEMVDAPQPAETRHTTWSAEQTASFLAVADRDTDAALWRLALLTGLRRGELLGLRWDDIDLAAGTATIRGALVRGEKGCLEMGQPKTRHGRRTIHLPPSVVEALRPHRTRQLEHRLAVGAAYQDGGLIFAGPLGAPIHPNTLKRRFDRLADAAGVPRIRIHDTRHSSASLGAANGETIKELQARLGHADPAITMRVYVHLTEATQRAAAERMDTLIQSASARLQTPAHAAGGEP
jgi:integrase